MGLVFQQSSSQTYDSDSTGMCRSELMIGYDRAQWFASQFREYFIAKYVRDGKTGFDVAEEACSNFHRRIFYAAADCKMKGVSPARCTARYLISLDVSIG